MLCPFVLLSSIRLLFFLCSTLLSKSVVTEQNSTAGSRYQESNAGPFGLEASVITSCSSLSSHSLSQLLLAHLSKIDLFSANQTEGVCLWDIRKPRQKVLEYGVCPSEKIRGAMSAVFSSDGTRILALGRRKPAFLYAIESPLKLFEFDHPGWLLIIWLWGNC